MTASEKHLQGCCESILSVSKERSFALGAVNYSHVWQESFLSPVLEAVISMAADFDLLPNILGCFFVEAKPVLSVTELCQTSSPVDASHYNTAEANCL